MSGTRRSAPRSYEDAGDGWILASAPELPGVFSQGRTREEARAMVRDGLREMLLAWAQTGATTPVTVGRRRQRAARNSSLRCEDAAFGDGR